MQSASQALTQKSITLNLNAEDITAPSAKRFHIDEIELDHVTGLPAILSACMSKPHNLMKPSQLIMNRLEIIVDAHVAYTCGPLASAGLQHLYSRKPWTHPTPISLSLPSTIPRPVSLAWTQLTHKGPVHGAIDALEPHDICYLISLTINRLEGPLLTAVMVETFEECGSIADMKMRIERLRELVSYLPDVNRTSKCERRC